MSLGGILIILVVVYAFILILVQSILSRLIDYANENMHIFDLKRKVPDFYYFFSLPRGNYEFAIKLFKLKKPPEDVINTFGNFQYLRAISSAALGFNFLIYIVFVILFFS